MIMLEDQESVFYSHFTKIGRNRVKTTESG